MSMVMNSSDLVGMDVFLHQFLSVLDSTSLSLIYNTDWFVCNILPKTNVHIFRAWKHWISVHCVWNWAYYLHSFGMVNLSASSRVVIEDSYRSIEWACDKLSSCRGKINVCYCSDMIFMDSFSLIHSTEIESVTIWIITSDGEIYRL